MPSVVVTEKNNPDRVYHVHNDKVLVGRDEKALLVLPNISVSRRHIQLLKVANDWYVKELGSQNGTELNGEKLESDSRHKLKSGDELLVGKFRLLFFDDGFLGLYKGQTLDELPIYSPFTAKAAEDATYRMSVAMKAQLKAANKVVEGARIILANDTNQTWRPEMKKLVFGAQGGPPVTGLFAKGEVAELTWNGKKHRLTKTASLTKVKINGKSITEQDLESGDRLTLGRTEYIYKVF